MKKYYLLLAILFGLTPALAFADSAVLSNGDATISITRDSGDFTAIFSTDNPGNARISVSSSNPYTFSSIADGHYSALSYPAGACNSSSTYTTCLPNSAGETTFTRSSGLFILPAPPAPPETLQSNINIATTTFSNMMGFTLDDSVSWMRGQLSLVIGSGFGVLYLLLPLIVAFISISCLVYFLYKGFRFYRH